MNIKNIKWSEQTYIEFINYLKSMQDLKYKKFHSSLVLNSKYEMIGIRLPIMRKIAKEIAQGSIEEFLKHSKNNYYEEVMLQGLVISEIKDEQEFYKHFNKHIKKIDNWALCDTFCNSIKIVKKYEEKYFKISKELALKNKEFLSRTGLVIILSHFINENNIHEILNMLNKIQSDKFYINMAEAWLICELYIKCPEQTIKFMQKNNLNTFTHNKAISKINDSYRISKEDKEKMKQLKIKEE